MSICIVTDDSSGMASEVKKYNNLRILKMPILMDGECFYEEINLKRDDLFKKIINGAAASTSQPSQADIVSVWRDALKYFDEIIFLPITSGLTSVAGLAKKIALEDEFKGKVYVCETYRISFALKATVLYAMKLIKEGKKASEIQEIIEKDALNYFCYLVVDDLKFLKKGGRLSSTAALVGSTLHIKPILKLKEKGNFEVVAKVVGYKKAIQQMIELSINELKEKFTDVDLSDLQWATCHTSTKENIDYLEDSLKLKTELKSLVKEDLPLVVSIHTGPNAIGMGALIKKY